MGLSLASYLQRTQRLLDDATFQRFNPYDLIEYVNEGRLQIAGASASIKASGTLTTVAGQQTYLNSAIILPTGQGLAGTLTVDRMWRVAPPANPGQQVPNVLMDGRPWGWFNLYFVTMRDPGNGLPTTWAQYQQGPTGSFYVGPPPLSTMTLGADVTAYPTSLTPQTVATDTDPIPYPWTDAVPFYAASLALRPTDKARADEMLASYQDYIARAGINVTPSDQSRSFPDRSVAVGSPPPQPAKAAS